MTVYEHDDLGLRVIGYNQGVFFYDPTRILRCELYLGADNALHSSCGPIVGGGGGGGAGLTQAVADLLYVRLDGNNWASWIPAGGTQSIVGSFNLAGAYQYKIGGVHALSMPLGGVSVGPYAGYYETSANKLFIDNATRASEADGRIKALVYGVFDAATANQYLTVNGHLIVRETATLANTGLHLLDTNASHDLIIAPGSDLSADRTLTIVTGDANRTLTLGASGAPLAATTRVIATPYAVLATDEVVLVDTDGGAITVNLPAGIAGTHYKIVNCGSSGNAVTLAANGAEKVHGAATQTLYDAEVLDLHFSSVEFWW